MRGTSGYSSDDKPWARFRRIGTAWAIAWLFICAHVQGAEKAESRWGSNVKLMTFNIGYQKDGGGWKKRQPIVLEIIAKHKPDVIGFQEHRSPQREKLVEDLPEYEPVGLQGREKGGRGECNPIFFNKSRYTLDKEESQRFWLSETPDEEGTKSWGIRYTRICEAARLVDKQTGRGFYVYNCHWSHKSTVGNDKGAELTLKRIAARKYKEPVVLLGDLNADEQRTSIRLVRGQGRSVEGLALVDTFRVLHPNAPAGTFHGYRGDPSRGRKIDYIFVSPADTKVLSAEILRDHRDGVYPSDHYPLTAEVSFR